MSSITKPYSDFVNNVDVADAAKVNAQINALYNFLNNANFDLTNLSTAAYSTSSVASTLVERDASQNIAVNFLKGGQNPNVVFNPSGRLGLAGWTPTNSGGSAWAAAFGSGAEGGYFNVGTVSSGLPILISTKFPVTAGSSLAISCEMLATGVTVGSQAMDIQFYDNMNAVISSLGRVNATNGTSWTKYSSTVTVPTNAVTASIRCLGDSGFTTTSSTWRKIKVEIGTVSTIFSDDNTINTVQYSSVLNLAQIVSGGNKVQSGTTGSISLGANSATTFTITFPTAFSGQGYVLACQFVTPSSGNSNGLSIETQSRSAGSVTVSIYNSGAAQTVYLDWISIGT